MSAVLGIDAAWTAMHPSGVALAVERNGHWHLAALTASYAEFLAIGGTSSVVEPAPANGIPCARDLLGTAEAIAGLPIDLVGIDMPLARTAVRSRRVADDAVSRSYGGRKCSTHSPTANRPGTFSDEFRTAFEQSGYVLCTDEITTPGLIEVYPHPALVELSGAPERLPYKAGKTRTYWRDLPLPERRAKLLGMWEAIVAMLDKEIAGVVDALPPLAPVASVRALKGYEDRIDAVVCAWSAIEALAGRARPYGDADAAIWIPHRA